MPPLAQPYQRSSEEVRDLHNIIDSATPERLRAVMKDLLKKSSSNWDHIQGELALPPGALKRAWSVDEESDNETEDSGNDYESDYSDEEVNATVKRQRFEICGQCSEEYDALLNDKKSCQWHDGDLEVDDGSEFWADHDERCHGTIDTDEMRKQYPEGFVWSCCDEPGDADGCKTSRHRPNRAKRVRR